MIRTNYSISLLDPIPMTQIPLIKVIALSHPNDTNTITQSVCLMLLCFDLLTRPKMPFKVMHRKEVTHSGGSYERKSLGWKLADEMGRGKKDPIILS